MDLKDVISLILLIIFLASYLLKLRLQAKRDNIKAFVLAKDSEKKDRRTYLIELILRITTLIWGIVWLIEVLWAEKINIFFPAFFKLEYISWVGVVVISCGLGVFILAMVLMKNSWRVGIDKETITNLVTTGLYQYSRNPAFVGFDLMFIGLFLSYANLLTLVVMSVNILVIHMLILEEEKHLIETFGDEYVEYKKKVPRYIGLF